VAARARQRGGTAQRGEPAFTGSIASRSATTGKKTVRDDDDDWIEDEPNLPW